MSELKGLATGIGSFPSTDPEQAVDLIFKYLPEIPFWPQLPKRDIREGMVAQFSEGFPCIRITPDGLSLAIEEQERELEKFYERLIASDTDYFKISPDFAQGLYTFYQRLQNSDLQNVKFIKCQLSGPFTFAASVKDAAGFSLLNKPELRQAVLKGLAMKALWQIEFFKKFGKELIVFFDEPYLSCLGSAYTPIDREEVIKGLTGLTEEIKASGGVLLGVHCCGNTDWSIFTETKGIDIINFDAFGFQDRFLLYADNLKEFLERGGIICWGIVPTQEFSGTETPEALVENLKNDLDLLVKKGLSRKLLLENLMLSPSCGLGMLDIPRSEAILKILSQTSLLVRHFT